jgi:hypothetical protein
MSWRRRILGSTILLGTAVLCIRPVMTMGIGNRLSEQLSVPVSIESSRFAFGQSTVYLSQLEINDPDCPFVAQEVALKLDGHALLYRNCVVESLVGKGMRWTLPVSGSQANHSALPLTIAKNESPHLGNLQVVLSQAAKELSQCEREAFERTKEWERQLVGLQSRIQEVASTTQHPNPLRASSAVQKLRSEIVIMEKLMAEDRVKARLVEQIVATATKQGSEIVASAESSPVTPVSSEPIMQSCASQIVDLALRKSQPYALAAEVGYSRLLQQIPLRATEESKLAQRTGRDLVLSTLPARERKLLRAKFEGESILGEQREETEVVISPIRLQQTDRSLLQIRWKAEGTSGGSRETTCRIGPISEMDSAEHHQLYLEQVDEHSRLVRQSSFKNGVCTRTMVVDARSLAAELTGIDESLMEQLHREFASQPQTQVVAKNVDSHHASTGGSISDWILTDESKQMVSSAVQRAIDTITKDCRARMLEACRAEMHAKRQTLEAKLAAFDENQRLKQQGWQAMLVRCKEMIDSLESPTKSAATRNSITR